MNETNGDAQTLETEMRNGAQAAEDLMMSCKKKYHPPILRRQAHLRDITLAGSPGIGESDAPGTNFPSEPEDDKNTGSGGIFDNDIFGG